MVSARRLVGKIEIETFAGAVFGDKRIRLLEAIDTHGSLTRAAKTVPLSYRAAWDALDSMNNLAEAPIVVRSVGGVRGGGTRLTEYGRRVIALYRAMESSQQDMLDRVPSPRALAVASAGTDTLRTLLRRMAVKTSARNQFVGTVVGITDVGGMTNVVLELPGGDELVASITPESIETMGLAPGAQVYALIKAPSVGVTTLAPRRSPARNAFAGVITALEPGLVRTRLMVTTPSGRVLAAAMPGALVRKRRLRKGQAAWAGFPTDSVILATFD